MNDPNRGTGRTQRQLERCVGLAKGGLQTMFVVRDQRQVRDALRRMVGMIGVDDTVNFIRRVVTFGQGKVYVTALDDLGGYQGLQLQEIVVDHAIYLPTQHPALARLWDLAKASEYSRRAIQEQVEIVEDRIKRRISTKTKE